MTHQNLLPTEKYEELGREMLGNEAYLLFNAERLINYAVKHLNACKKDLGFVKAK